MVVALVIFSLLVGIPLDARGPEWGQTALDVMFGRPVSIVVRLVNPERLDDFEKRDLLVRVVSLNEIEQGLPSLDTRFGHVASYRDKASELRMDGLAPGRQSPSPSWACPEKSQSRCP